MTERRERRSGLLMPSFRTFRRLELALLVVLLVFSAQFFLVMMHLHQHDKPVSIQDGKDKDLMYSTTSGSRTEPESIPKAAATTIASGKTKKRQHKEIRRKQRWDPGLNGLGGDPIPLKINLPVFVPSLPKSGTTSIWQYFNCGGHRASHQWVKINDTYSEQSGQCIARNVAAAQPPFQGCGEYAAFTDTGYANYFPKTGSSCYYPSVDALNQIYEHYPNSTFVMVVRNTTKWYESMANWAEGSLLSRWRPCNATGFPGWKSAANDIMRFYDWHTDNIRQFVKAHPSLKYIEIDLEDKQSGQLLERDIGIPAKCWAKCTPYSKFCKEAG
jgi:Sulfotransferase domain